MVVGPEKLEVWLRPRETAHFESETWKSAPPADGIRYEMVDALLSKGNLIGIREDELTAILGEPDMAGDFDQAKVVIYVLAAQREYPSRSIFWPGLLMNHELWTLKVKLEEGKVTRAWVDFS